MILSGPSTAALSLSLMCHRTPSPSTAGIVFVPNVSPGHQAAVLLALSLSLMCHKDTRRPQHCWHCLCHSLCHKDTRRPQHCLCPSCVTRTPSPSTAGIVFVTFYVTRTPSPSTADIVFVTICVTRTLGGPSIVFVPNVSPEHQAPVLLALSLSLCVTRTLGGPSTADIVLSLMCHQDTNPQHCWHCLCP